MSEHQGMPHHEAHYHKPEPQFYTVPGYGDRIVLRIDPIQSIVDNVLSVFKGFSLPAEFTLFLDQKPVDSCKILGNEERSLRGQLDGRPINIIIVWKHAPWQTSGMFAEIGGTRHRMEFHHHIE